MRYQKRFSRTLGSYTPSFFMIEYAYPGSPSDILNSDKANVFLHEYIHFLQDLITPFGNINLCNTYNRIRAIAGHINDLENQEVRLPVKMTYSETISTSIDYWYFIYGCNSNNRILDGTENIEILIEERNFPDVGTCRRYYFLTNRGRYNIGAIDIIESHAYLIERLLYNKHDAPILPYRCASILAYNYSKWIFHNPQFLCALLELSLNTSNPADFYITNLLRIKDFSFECSDVDELVNFVTDGLSYRSPHLKAGCSFNEAAAVFSKKARDFTLDTVKNKQTSEARKWVDEVFKRGLEVRLSDPIFLTRGLFKSNPIEYYTNIMNKFIGGPLIIDGDGNSYLFENEYTTNQIVYFAVIRELLDLFTSNSKIACNLKKACLRSLEISDSYEVNHKCSTMPLLKISEDRLCPLCSILFAWGLGDIKFFK